MKLNLEQPTITIEKQPSSEYILVTTSTNIEDLIESLKRTDKKVEKWKKEHNNSI